MENLRVIHTIDKLQGEERITFTQDFDADVFDYIPPGFTLESDTTWEVEIPPGFPCEHEFIKSS